MATAQGTSSGVSAITAALGSRIRRHGQPSGEEILVLEGVFHDELGGYRAGSWLRNPPASVNRPTAGYPRSKWIGCVSNNQARDTRRFLNCLSRSGVMHSFPPDR